jgi:ATP-binding cassette subfamily C exporter for protease/lipase
MKINKPMGRDGKPLKSELMQALWLEKDAIKNVAWLSLIINLMMLAPTIYMMEVYDRVVNSRNSTTLMMLLMLVVFVYLIMELLDFVRTKIMSEVGLNFDKHIRIRAFDAMYEARRLMNPGGTPQVMNDLRVIKDFIASPVIHAFMDAPVSFLFLLIVFMIHPSMALFALVGAVLQLVLAIMTEKSTGKPLMEANRAAMNAQSFAGSSLRNSESIEAMGMYGNIHAKWLKMQRKFLSLQAIASDNAGSSAASSKVIQMAQGSLMLGLGCWLSLLAMSSPNPGAAANAVNPSLIIVASVLGGRMLAPLVQLISQWKMVAGARDAFERLDTLLQLTPAKTTGMSLPPPVGAVQVENVYAAAPGGSAHILKGVNFSLNAGECLVVLGPSASGKSTLARLLIGVWGAANGKVRLDGVDVYAWDKSELGPHLGYLPQTVELFDGTVAENIARFGNVDLGKVKEAAALVGLDSLIESLPEGYNTPVGEDGAVLSGGQRQRLGLARAVYGVPKLIVLDEPNSSLDELGDAALMQALQKLKEMGTTVVVISHRSNVLEAADKLLILREGQVQAFGPRDQILNAIKEAKEKHLQQLREANQLKIQAAQSQNGGVK